MSIYLSIDLSVNLFTLTTAASFVCYAVIRLAGTS